MIEDYGTLSEDELLVEIKQELDEKSDIDPTQLEFAFEEGKLIIQGTLANGEELETLVGVLENHIDPEDYDLHVELLDGDSETLRTKGFQEGSGNGGKKGEEILEEALGDVEDDEMDFVEEDEVDDEDEDEKW